MRALIYIRLPGRSVDERGYAAIQAFRKPSRLRSVSASPAQGTFTEQFLLLKQDEERAVRALTVLLPADARQRRTATALLRRAAAASGTPSEEGSRRLARVEALFNVADQANANDEMADT